MASYKVAKSTEIVPPGLKAAVGDMRATAVASASLMNIFNTKKL